MDALPQPAKTVVEQFLGQNLHGSTPQNSLEWWYLTGHFWQNNTCNTSTGFPAKETSPDLGLQYTSFYSGQGTNQGSLLHTAHTFVREQKHEVQTRWEAFAPGKTSGVLSQVNPQWLDNFYGNTRLQQLGKTAQANWQLNMQTTTHEFSLVLQPQALWLHGKQGYAEKINGKGNVYVSMPFVPAQGIMTELKTQKRSEICGSFWFDHEVGVQQVDKVQWHWFAIRFPSGKAYMIYDIRAQNGAKALVGEVFQMKPSFKSAASKLTDLKIEESKNLCLASGNCYPQSFNLKFKENNRNVSVSVTALLGEQEILAPEGQGKNYWEGMASARLENGETGQAYVEMTN
jgi:predicted secreted hydrolase